MKGVLDKAIFVCILCGSKSLHNVYDSGLMGNARVIFNTNDENLCGSIEGMCNLSSVGALIHFLLATLDFWNHLKR